MEKIAKILRADKHTIEKLEERLSVVTGKKGVFEKVDKENDEMMKDRLQTLGISAGAPAKEVYDALISKIEADDYKIFHALGNPVCSKHEDCNKILDMVSKVFGVQKGLFLKREKAIEFLHKEPPKEVMKFLGYKTVDEMLAKEDLLEVYSSLRFIEGSEWLNAVFFKQYERLKPSDFEEREIVIKALSEKWGKAAKNFVLKKRHNISHLKEMGVVFVIPLTLDISGEILRMISMIFHYLNEIPFYSDMFRKIAEIPELFAENFISLLRGDVLERHLPEGEKALFLVIQRYLAKDDENDWRLFVPHINPEALHWEKAEGHLVEAGKAMNSLGADLSFWQDLGWVGDYFKDEVGNNVLVSFDLVDTVMSLVKEKELTKYLYHHQEALWNKIFSEYFGDGELEKFSKDYLLQGYFEI